MKGSARPGPGAEAFRHEGFRGEGEPDVLPALLAVVGTDPTAVVRDGPVLRESRYRLSGPVPVPEVGTVLLKAHRMRKRGERLLSVVKPSRARTEWDAARHLQAAGIPVARPLAYGERRRGLALEAAFFAASFVEDRETLQDALTERNPMEAHRLLERAARWIRALHDGAFDHRDLHAGNVLVPRDGQALLFVDLHRSRHGRFVGRRARVAALARFLHSFFDDAGPGARGRVLRAYAPDASREDRQSRLADVQAEIDRLERVRRKSRAKRCFLESTVYTRDVGDGWGARRRDFSRQRLGDALRAHDEALAADDDRVAKRARKAVVTRHGDLVVKESVPLGTIGRLKDRFAPGRHRAGYRNAHLLDVLGVSTARPLAWVRRHGRAYALYADLSERERLDHRARRLYATDDRAAQACLRRAAADWLGRLHRRGIYHGDLKGVNVLVGEEGGDLDFALIDTDRVRVFVRGVDRRRRVKNLAQLAASIPVTMTKTDRLRFFRRYAAGSPLANDERGVAREVAAQLALKTVVVDEPIE